MNVVCGLDWRNLAQIDEKKIINQGANAEQFIGQHLQAILANKPNRELAYWLREAQSSNAELYFVAGLTGNNDFA